MARDPFLLDSTQPKTIVPAKPCIAHVQLRDLMICPRERGLVNYVVERGIVEQDVHAPGAPTRLLARLGFTPNSLTSLPVGVNDTLIAAGGQDREIHLSYHVPSSSSSSSSSTSTSTTTKTRSRARTPTRQSWEFEDRLTGSINNSILLTPLTSVTTSLNLTPTQQSAVEPRVGISNNDGSIRMYDVPLRVHSSRRKLVCVGEVRLDVPINHSSISPDGRTLLSVGDSSKIYLHQITGGARIDFSPIHTLAVPPIPSAFSPLAHSHPLPPRPYVHNINSRHHSHSNPYQRTNLNHLHSLYAPPSTALNLNLNLNLNPYASYPSYTSTSSLAASFSTAFSGDGSKFAVASQEGVVAVWDVRYLGGAMRVWYTDRSRGLSGSSSSSLSSSTSGGGWDRGVLGGIGSGSGSPPLSASSSYDANPNSNNIYNNNANANANANSYLSDDPWEWTRGTRAPGWCVRSVKFNSGEGARMGKEVMCFTEHTSQIHIVDARTFETHDVIRVPTLFHPSSSGSSFSSGSRSGAGMGTGRRRSNRGVSASGGGGGVAMVRGPGAGGGAGGGGGGNRRRVRRVGGDAVSGTTSTTSTINDLNPGLGQAQAQAQSRGSGDTEYTRADVERIAERLADVRERAFVRRDQARDQAQFSGQSLGQRGQGGMERDRERESGSATRRGGGMRTAGSTSTTSHPSGNGTGTAHTHAHAHIHGYHTGIVQALGDAFRISLPVSSGAASSSSSSASTAAVRGMAGAPAVVHSAPTTLTGSSSASASSAANANANANASASASGTTEPTTAARRYSPPASIGDSTWRTLSGATVRGRRGNEEEEDMARMALEEINRQEAESGGDDEEEASSDEEEEEEESRRRRGSGWRRVRQRMMSDIVVVPDLGDREVESEVHAVLAVHGIPSRLDARYEDDLDDLDDEMDEMDVDIQEIEDAEGEEEEEEEEEYECLSRPGSRGASPQRRTIRQGGVGISPAESTSMRYGSRSSSGSWSNLSHTSNPSTSSSTTTQSTTPAYPDDLDLAGMCFDPCGERMYVLGVIPPSTAAGVGGDLGWGLGLAREETAGAGAGAGAVVEWSVRGAEKRWWVDEGWM